ncbi:response regulator transcription factor [Petralouisia muris]|uniref:Response regulator transcription factor n=1 Tax=Petralouisia muris TaxID=3032872 RepID=A0AC61S0A0_9FIRM|nr:LytTR family DNA-binding domain-containing protein [Petralouisia muris]TGY97238.1 response regulator transcription factor [Petralouisia muris]
MVRIAIVEDEELYIEKLTEYLGKYQNQFGEQFEITVYRDGDGITSQYQAQFDIILMDIQMKFMDGMSAAEEIRRQDSQVVIIFITNMAQYAIRGYEVDALDYILKPVSYFAFSQKLSRAISRIPKEEDKKFTISVKGGILCVSISDIYYVESAGHNLLFHTASGTHMTSGTMKSAEEKLTAAGFSRGNKCYLINLEHVEGIQDKCAVVKGEMLQISRPRMSRFMQDLTRYWGDVL